MIVDLNDLEDDGTYDADICVIGGGAAGIAMAREFFDTPHRMILVEGGARRHESPTQRLYDTEIVGLPHVGVHVGRARVLGGTTTLWAGQALPLCEIDFRERDWVPDSGWPLTRAELEPYYRRAERVMHLEPMTYDERAWPPSAAKPPRYDPSKFQAAISQFSPQPNFARAYHAGLRRSRNITVLLHANATAIHLGRDSPSVVERVEVRSLGGKKGSVRARYYVVCCGGIETARLLLASDSVDPRGVGNAHDLVGRYFLDHVHTKAAVILPRDRRTLGAMFNAFYDKGIKYAPKILSTAELQEDRRILNVAGDVCYDIPEDSAVESAKLILRAARRPELRPALPRAVGNTLRRPNELFEAVYRRLIYKETLYPKRGPIYLGVQSEQQPNPDSRVRLGESVDALGMRRTALDWRLTELDRRTIEVFVREVAVEFERLGIGRIDLSTFALSDFPTSMGERVHDSSHHMGTSRMHDDPKRGVVDRHCRVHGVRNLFVGSSSVFPTCGFSNPTLTIIALCLRMSDGFKRDLTHHG
jgi:choline dehydrogenase-like flavoprotein